MSMALTDQVTTELARFSAKTRLYELIIENGSVGLGSGGLLVEAFSADDMLNDLGISDLIVLSTSAHIVLEQLLGQSASLEIALADGSRTSFSGEISEIAMLGSDGGLARYRVRISRWLWRLGQVRNCRVWQDKSVIEIVDSVLHAYLPLAVWRWSDEVSSFMACVPPRAYCCQYRESDLDFIRRILAEEGLNWRFEQTGDGPAMVLFADSSHDSAVPEDPSSEMDGGIRYHGVSAVEHRDTVQALTAQRRLHASLTTVLGYDYKAKQTVAASSPTRVPRGRNVPALEACETHGRWASRAGIGLETSPTCRWKGRRHADSYGAAVPQSVACARVRVSPLLACRDKKPARHPRSRCCVSQAWA